MFIHHVTHTRVSWDPQRPALSRKDVSQLVSPCVFPRQATATRPSPPRPSMETFTRCIPGLSSLLRHLEEAGIIFRTGMIGSPASGLAHLTHQQERHPPTPCFLPLTTAGVLPMGGDRPCLSADPLPEAPRGGGRWLWQRPLPEATLPWVARASRLGGRGDTTHPDTPDFAV